MGKVYSGVEGINKPDNGGDWETYWDRAEAYEKRIIEYAKKNSSCSEAGKVIRFGVADGKASYVVFSLKPVVLIHLAIGDAYQYQYAHRLTASDVRQEIKGQEALDRLFAGKE